MTSNDSTTDLPQSGVVTYPVTINVNIDLDQDEKFRSFDAETREAAIQFATVAIANRGQSIFEDHPGNTVTAEFEGSEEAQEVYEGVMALRQLFAALDQDEAEVTA